MRSLSGKECSVTIIGAVSPQGSDFSEPVTQNTKRFVRTFWALDKSLAYARHYPSINWNTSYSEYVDDLSRWYDEREGDAFLKCRLEITAILQAEARLMEIVKLIGSDVLPDDQKLTMEVAKVIRVGFLQQNAFHADDTYVPLDKQLKMMQVILYLNLKCKELVAQEKPISHILATGIFEKVTRIKYDVPNDKPELFDGYNAAIDEALTSIA
jgi:V/A-type H+-transporting ATPase subunit A